MPLKSNPLSFFILVLQSIPPMTDFDTLKSENGLILAIVQDQLSREVLMCAFMNREALEKTVETGIAHFWSRSRQTIIGKKRREPRGQCTEDKRDQD